MGNLTLGRTMNGSRRVVLEGGDPGVEVVGEVEVVTAGGVPDGDGGGGQQDGGRAPTDGGAPSPLLLISLSHFTVV